MSQSITPRARRVRVASISFTLLNLLAAAPLYGAAQNEVAAPQVGSQPSIASGQVDVVSITVLLGTSELIRAPWPVTRVSITNPEIADVQMLSPSQVLLTASTIGTTDLIIWGEQDSEQVWHARVSVRADLSYVQEELQRLFPDAALSCVQSRDMVIVNGQLRRADDAARLKLVLDGFAVKFVDATTVAGVQQVELHVRVAEVSRRDIRALGVNAFFGGDTMFGGSVIGPSSGGPINPASIGAAEGSAINNIPFSFLADTAVSSGVTLFTGFPGSDLQLFIQALAENQYVKVLAEPTLIALSGEQATFLAGGEFPIPVVQGSTAGTGSSITIEYKEFGVRLAFLPIVLGENAIRLRVAPEVSDLSDLGAVEISGFRVPSVLTRRAETTLELKSGQTFAMAGLLNNAVSARSSRVPILGDLPIIGPLFRSVRYQRGETELVVMVTATLVEPMSLAGEILLPGDLHETPSDWELYMDGRLEGLPRALPPTEAARLRDLGLDQLEGPGAWATFRQRRDRAGSDGIPRYEG